jgi:hypothetical protein
MSEKKQVVAASPPNPLDVVPEKIPFDVPYGPPWWPRPRNAIGK